MVRQIFVGYDPREVVAYRVCIESLKAHSERFAVQPVNSRLLGTLYQRPESKRGKVLWDEISDAPMATEFSIARFFVPYLAVSGWALYCDCDFLFRANVEELFSLADDEFDVMCVQHEHQPTETEKMDGQVQTTYPRKNWSSLMLFNCDRIRGELPPEEWLDLCNTARGIDLHGFKWTEKIGSLPMEWNWLAGVSRPVEPRAVHFTLGTPDMPGYENAPYADEWRAYVG